MYVMVLWLFFTGARQFSVREGWAERCIDSHHTYKHLTSRLLCFVPRSCAAAEAGISLDIYRRTRVWFSSISYVKDAVVIKWVLKSTPHAPHLPVCCNKRATLAQRGDGASRGQVCGSCSHLWANTGCLFSSGTHRSDCRSDIINCPQNDTSD